MTHAISMPGCAVSGCLSYNRKTKGTDVKYYRFPKNEDLARQWLHACRREDEVNLQHDEFSRMLLNFICFATHLQNIFSC